MMNNMLEAKTQMRIKNGHFNAFVNAFVSVAIVVFMEKHFNSRIDICKRALND